MNNYEALRMELINDVKAQEEKEVINLKAFDKKFNQLFEMTMFQLLNDSNDAFYGTFLCNCNRVKCYGLGAPFAHQMFNTKINLLINPLMIITLDQDTVKAYLKHEIIHLLAMHYERVEILKQRYAEMVPLMATDIVANVLLAEEVGKDNMHKQMLTVDKFNEMFNEALAVNRDNTAEEVSEMIYQLSKNNEKLSKFINDYNSFVTDEIQQELEKQIYDYQVGRNQEDDDVEMDFDEATSQMGEQEMTEEQQMQQLANMLAASVMKVKGEMMLIGSMLKNVVIETSTRNRGKYPGGLMSLIKRITAPPVITWQQVLRRLINSLPAGKKPTQFRRDRRQPDRLDLKGKLPDKEIDLVFAIDTSGSVSNDDVANICSELFAITKLMKARVTVVECDTQICKVYEANSPEEVQVDVAGRGGTSFTPVFEWLQENRNSDTVLIYSTDGYGEGQLECENITQATIWLLTETKESLSCKNNIRSQDKLLSLTNK